MWTHRGGVGREITQNWLLLTIYIDICLSLYLLSLFFSHGHERCYTLSCWFLKTSLSSDSEMSSENNPMHRSSSDDHRQALTALVVSVSRVSVAVHFLQQFFHFRATTLLSSFWVRRSKLGPLSISVCAHNSVSLINYLAIKFFPPQFYNEPNKFLLLGKTRKNSKVSFLD